MRRLTIVLGVVILAIFVVATIRRNEVWRSEVRLWEDAARKSPLKPRPRQNLGVALVKAGDRAGAFRQFTAAMELAGNRSPHEAEAAFRLATLSLSELLINEGRYSEAATILVEGWSRAPRYPGYAINLAVLSMMQGEPEYAVGILNLGVAGWGAEWRSFQLPGHLFWNRGEAYRMLGRCLDAQRDYQRAARLDRTLGAPPLCVKGDHESHRTRLPSPDVSAR